MNREKIINMVIEAGAYRTKKYPEEWHLDGDDLRRFAKLIAEHEREECVKRASVALLGTLQTTTDRVLKAIKGEKSE